MRADTIYAQVKCKRDSDLAENPSKPQCFLVFQRLDRILVTRNVTGQVDVGWSFQSLMLANGMVVA